jgi:hypothetical protein
MAHFELADQISASSLAITDLLADFLQLGVS